MNLKVKKYQILLVLAIIDLALIFLLVSYYKILKSDTRIVLDAAENQRKSLAGNKPAEQIKADIDLVTTGLKKMNFFVEESKALALIQKLEETAGRLNLKQQLRVLAASADALPMEIVLIGDYLDEVKYVTSLEALDYHMKINRVRVDQFLDDKQQLLIRMTLEVESFKR